MHNLAKFLEIAGLSLQFLAFWFAAPELLGEDRLQSWQARLVAAIHRAPAILAGLIWVSAGTTFSILGSYNGLLQQGMSPDDAVQRVIWKSLVPILLLLAICFPIGLWLRRRQARKLAEHPELESRQTRRRLWSMALAATAVTGSTGFAWWSGRATERHIDSMLVPFGSLSLLIFLGTAVAFLGYFLYRWKIQAWVETHIAVPLIEKLVASEETRFRSLQVGAILFTLGFAFLIAGVIATP
jgi:hypothetical protein